MRLRLLLMDALITVAFSAVWLIMRPPATQASVRLLPVPDSAPALRIPTDVTAMVSHPVTLPIGYRHHGAAIAGVAFSLDFDPACLNFDNRDQDGDQAPDAVRFALPPQLRGSVSYDPTDVDGELDIVAADFSPPLATLSDTDSLVAVSFTAICTPAPGESIVSAVEFSTVPRASFSDTAGQDVAGTTTNGAVVVVGQHVVDPNADTSIRKSVTPTHTIPGQVVTYTLEFSNAGPDRATGVLINDAVPASMTVIGALSAGVAVTQTGVAPDLVWVVTNLAPGVGGVMTITGVISSSTALIGTVITNTAAISATNDLTPTNNSSAALLLVDRPDTTAADRIFLPHIAQQPVDGERNTVCELPLR